MPSIINEPDKEVPIDPSSVPLIPNQATSRKAELIEVTLVLVVSKRESDPKDPNLDHYFNNTHTYALSRETAKRIVKVIPMAADLDTYTFALDAYLSSSENWYQLQPYGIQDVGYIRLTPWGVATCCSDEVRVCNCGVIKRFQESRADSYYWYKRAEVDAEALNQRSGSHVIEAGHLEMLIDLIEKFMSAGWRIPSPMRFNCGTMHGGPLWNIKLEPGFPVNSDGN